MARLPPDKDEPAKPDRPGPTRIQATERLLHEREGRRGETRALLQRAIATDPDHPFARRSLAALRIEEPTQLTLGPLASLSDDPQALRWLAEAGYGWSARRDSIRRHGPESDRLERVLRGAGFRILCEQAVRL